MTVEAARSVAPLTGAWIETPPRSVAAFFATSENYDVDGAIYIYNPDSIINHEIAEPFDYDEKEKKVKFHLPNSSSSRIINQLGYFSVHGNPKLALNDKTKEGTLEKIIIKKEIKKDLMFMLNQYGINYLTLFPDLEGLSKHLGWFAENYNYWDNSFEN